MFLRFFRRLWSRAYTRFTALFHRAKTLDAGASTYEQSVGSHLLPEHYTTIAPIGGFVSASWLDDMRRMRSQLAATKKAKGERLTFENEPSTPVIRTTLPPRTAPIFPVIPPPHLAESNPKLALPGASPASAAPGESAATSAPPTQPLAPIPAANNDSAAFHEQTNQHRLISLRNLVRMGIYNEGFTTNNAPEQYQHSLGMDTPDAAADDMDEPEENR